MALDTNGTQSPGGYNWESLAATAAAWAAAGVALMWPGHAVPTSVQDTLTALAGLLTAAHVHMPKIVAQAFSSIGAWMAKTTAAPAPPPSQVPAEAVAAALTKAAQDLLAPKS